MWILFREGWLSGIRCWMERTFTALIAYTPLEKADTQHSKQAARPLNGNYLRDGICGPLQPLHASSMLHLRPLLYTLASAQLRRKATTPPICKELSRHSSCLYAGMALLRGWVVESSPAALQLVSLTCLRLKIFWNKQKGILHAVESKSGKPACQ